jgi:hypothetical protein
VSDPVDPLVTDDAPPVDDTPPATRRVGTADVAVVAAELALILGVVIGFNQLATQSPVDAILPVALFSVGVAGVLALVAALVGLRPSAPDATDPLAAPGLDSGVASFALGLAALAAVGWRWGVAAQAALVGVQGVRLLVATEVGVVTTLRRAPGRPDAYRLVLTAAEAVVLLVFAVAALADAGIRPFT